MYVYKLSYVLEDLHSIYLAGLLFLPISLNACSFVQLNSSIISLIALSAFSVMVLSLLFYYGTLLNDLDVLHPYINVTGASSV